MKIPKKYIKKIPVEIKQEKGTHYVYFILTQNEKDEDRSVKIGMSSTENGVLSRFEAANTYNPIGLKLLGYLKGYERDWHNYFKEHKIKGEWFSFKEIKSILANLKLKLPKKILDNYRNGWILREGRYNSIEDRIQEEGKMKDSRYATTKYQQMALTGREYFYHRDYEEDEKVKENYIEDINDAPHICRILNLLGFGKIDLSYPGYNKVVKIIEAATAKLDLFNDPINEGEIYYRTDPSYGSGYDAPYGISLRTGKKLFKIFKNYMKVRNNDFYGSLSSGTKHKSNIKINEKVDLCNILGSMASKIEREIKGLDEKR
tara:strand:+ start:90 stop:1040 length:951 start_codon:yes stop_codon:yes gene_type:complete